MHTKVETGSPTDLPRGGSGQMFDRIADRYDLLNRLISFGVDQRWRHKAVSALELSEASARVLDVAAGTADLSILVAQTHPLTAVVGLDPSTRMLAVGRQKVSRIGLDQQVTLLEGAAEMLPFADGMFDGVTIAFGIRNVPDRELALREMARVTKPGGKICILELSEPPAGPLGSLARFHVHKVVPWLGGLLSGDSEYQYLQRSIAAFPSPADFRALMQRAGLEVLLVKPLTFGVCHLFVATPVRTP